MPRNTGLVIISILFILLFTYSAVSKMLDYEQFKVQLGLSPVLTMFSDWVAWCVPVVEILVVGLLANARFRLTGLYASFGLMVLFSCYIIAITRFSEYIPCSCGGILQNITWNQHLVINIFFLLLGAAGVLLYRDREKIKSTY